MLKYLNILGSTKRDFLAVFFPFILIIIFNVGLYLYNPNILFSKDSNFVFGLILFLALMIFDVPHVWATIYKTYTDKSMFDKYRFLYLAIPGCIFITVLALVFSDPTLYLLFWVLAMFAAFHFIKQQLGFIMLYAYKEDNKSKESVFLDKTASWLVTLVPMIYWLSNLDTRNYNWFTDAEFVKLPDILFPAIWYIMALFFVYYVYHEVLRYIDRQTLNLGKYAYLIGTFIVWFYGIVWTNNMLIFGFGNMILHGWNFFGIVYYTVKDKIARGEYKTPKILSFFLNKNILWFILPIFLIGFIEQSTWALIADNDAEYFHYIFSDSLFNMFKNINPIIFALLISLLTLPQTTHYVLDGIIWKKDHN